ncbi:Serine/threonine-protein phosphatase 6 regulatory ankyrin repeat subunit B [Paramyrothecium foliicola]|nr:Serine/threonine-protein phosphatase 6 regulatory ankyrin repeat subunit B [Paramyrothecium foliicola]
MMNAVSLMEELMAQESIQMELLEWLESIYRDTLEDKAWTAPCPDSLARMGNLHSAAYRNQTAGISRLLQINGQIDVPDSQSFTALHWACFGKNHEAISILIKHNACLESKDISGWTPMFWAAIQGDIAVVKLLLEHKASHLVQDKHGWTVVRWATMRGQMNVVEILLNYHISNLSSLKGCCESRESHESVKHRTVQEILRYSITTTQKVDVPDMMKEVYLGAIEPNARKRLLYLFEHGSLELGRIWNASTLDIPEHNVWQYRAKEESYYGYDCHIECPFEISRLSANWKSSLLLASIKDNQLSAMEILLAMGADVNYQGYRRAGRIFRTPLHTAAFRKDPIFAELLINYGADIEALDWHCMTPLQQAVLNGFEKVVQLLLAKGAMVNVAQVPGARPWNRGTYSKKRGEPSARTPLQLACGLRAPDDDPELPHRIIELLLRYGADVRMKDTKPVAQEAVHYAAFSRDPKKLELIIDAGASVRTLDEAGRTTVHLLILGAEKSWQVPKLDDHGNIEPLEASECLKILKERSDLEFLSQSAEWGEHYQQEPNFWTSMQSVHTPLSLALLVNDWELFQRLNNLDARFETNVPLNSMLNGLDLPLIPDGVRILCQHGGKLDAKKAVWIRTLAEHYKGKELSALDVLNIAQTFQILVKAGFDINTQDISYWDSATLLHKFVLFQNSGRLVESSLEIGSNPFLEDGTGLDVFMSAILASNIDATRCLLQYSANKPLSGHWTEHVHYEDNWDKEHLIAQIGTAWKSAGILDGVRGRGTLLLEAIDRRATSIAINLLRQGADPNLLTKKLQHALHLAAMNGDSEILRLLVESPCVDVDVRDELQRTPLHYAADKNHSKVIEALLSKGANPNAADKRGWLALHFACWRGHTEAARCLVDAGSSVTAVISHHTLDEGFNEEGDEPEVGDQWAATALHFATMAENPDIVRMLLVTGQVDVNARSDNFEGDGGRAVLITPKTGPRALHIALDTGRSFGGRGHWISETGLNIASMLVEHGAAVDGVADHLGFDDIRRFEKYPDLWDKLRVGIKD